jgi:hypothetical protein
MTRSTFLGGGAPLPSPSCRFIDANIYDWGRTVDDDVDDDPSGKESDGNYNKPGVIVKRDDEAGYMIIDKPPNIPVHARVDNSLENRERGVLRGEDAVNGTTGRRRIRLYLVV